MNVRTTLPLIGGLAALGLLGYGATLAFAPSAPVEAAIVMSLPASSAQASGPPAGAMAGTAAAQAPMVDEAWIATTSGQTGISTTALRAYATAQLRAPESCGLGWTTLAGIGWVESHHGTIDGRSLGADGVPSAPITGIPLGDLDRAYGPMQFIPSTWEKWGIDGDGDGIADPQNIHDAALAAANYLCADGSVATPEAWSDAVFSYNHSYDYVRQVYDAAQEYAERAN